MRKLTSVLVLLVALTAELTAQSAPVTVPRLGLRDIFELEWAAEPQIAPDGRRIVFERGGYDVMKDAARSTLWIVNTDGTELRPLVDPTREASSPRWSPDGSRVLFVSSVGDKSDLFVRWMDTGQEAKLTHLEESPRGLAWSPDGQWIAFTMFVPDDRKPFVQLPAKPDGADWGPEVKFIDQLQYRYDGRGYLRAGHRHVFVVPASGGTSRQLTDGPWDDGEPRWAPDGASLLFSAKRIADADYEPLGSEVYEVQASGGAVKALTTRKGPDEEPVVSPDGTLIAYTGFDDRQQGYQVTRLYVMNRDGSGSRVVSAKLDRDVGGITWARDGRSIYFQYDDQGDTKIGVTDLAGNVRTLAGGVGGLDLGRPYGVGSFSVARDGRFAFTQTAPDHPADVAVGGPAQPVRRLTHLNDDLFAGKQLASVEEIWFESSFDKRRVQGWIARPPGFDPTRKYPLLLEIHGGPFANYGPRFTTEIQLYAAAGYVVLYTNPRGSTSYGEEFGNLIHHDYPNHDYEDLMSGVDAVIAKGFIDPQQLNVTGGSGGGVLTAWIVGHTKRFRAAVVQKPVINWSSFVLTSDEDALYTRYWFPGFPWDNAEQYAKRSPITYVGNVTTPTMLVTGEVDYRTPSSEAEQFYEALRLRKIPTAMVRFPDAPHDISAKPSNMMAKVAYIVGWLDKYRNDPGRAVP
ncbi:MAG TPA: S9 family peptidase [Gemmatimonadaceae bacterium]